MNPHSLIEICLSGLDYEASRSVASLFDQWGRGGSVVEHRAGENDRFTVKTYLQPEDDQALQQIEIGLELLKRARDAAAQAASTRVQPLPAAQIRFLAEQDWAETWKANYPVLHVGRHLVIKPTWREYTPQPDERVIALDPGMAFGSGLHPTTCLCLEAIEDYLPRSAHVLDLGTGSGILAIAAARLGAAHVLALDTDPLAVRIARENVALNQLDGIIQVEEGTLPIANPQSLIVANILAETIIELAPALAAGMAWHGILIASGIILDRAEAVVAALRAHGLWPIARRDEGEWVALVVRKETHDAAPMAGQAL